MHELGHALGLAHEWKRSDRNKYFKWVKAEWAETAEMPEILTPAEENYLGTPFDYESVMQYYYVSIINRI